MPIADKDQQVVAILLQPLCQLFEHRRVKQVFDVGQHQADDARAPRDQTAGMGVGLVAQLARGLLHLVAHGV